MPTSVCVAELARLPILNWEDLGLNPRAGKLESSFQPVGVDKMSRNDEAVGDYGGTLQSQKI